MNTLGYGVFLTEIQTRLRAVIELLEMESAESTNINMALAIDTLGGVVGMVERRQERYDNSRKAVQARLRLQGRTTP